MGLRTGFALDADISVSELRQEDVLEARLREHHRLRLRRRNEVLGVLIDADEWRAVEQRIARLEEELEHREAEAVRALILAREPYAQPQEATDEVIADIQRQYESLI